MKEVFLGGILAVLLFLLWRKEQGHPISASTFNPLGGDVGAGSGAGGCGGNCGVSPGSPSAGASPVAQRNTWDVLGMGGQISPGTPPLQSSVGVGSFYGPDGPTPDTTFTNVAQPTPIPSVATKTDFGPTGNILIYGQPTPPANNVPGSPTTPANIVPVRAAQPTGTYANTGFVQRYNVVGVPRVYSSRTNWVM